MFKETNIDESDINLKFILIIYNRNFFWTRLQNSSVRLKLGTTLIIIYLVVWLNK